MFEKSAPTATPHFTVHARLGLLAKLGLLAVPVRVRLMQHRDPIIHV